MQKSKRIVFLANKEWKDPSSMKNTLRSLQTTSRARYHKDSKDSDSHRMDDAEKSKDKDFYKVQKKFHSSVNKFAKDIEKVS